MIRFSCKNCGQKFTVSDQKAGKKGKCPKCKQTIVIPPAAQESAQQSSRIKFHCPSCNQKIAVAADYAGKRVRCAKCKNPLRVPQALSQAGPPVVKDQTDVLRAGRQPPPPEEDFLQDMLSLDAQSLAEGPPVEPGSDDYGTDETPAHSGRLPPGPFAQATVAGEQPGKSRKTIFIIAACVAGAFIIGIIASLFLGGPDTDQSQTQLPTAQVQQFAEQYIGLLENGEIDKARQLLSPALASYVQNSQLEKFAQQISKNEIIEMDCWQTHSKQYPEGNQFFLWYHLRYEDGDQNVIVSVLQIEQGLTIDGIAAQDCFGHKVSIGPKSFDVLSQIAVTAAFEKFESFFTKFFCGFMLFVLVIALIQVVSWWIVFEKAGRSGWASIVPYYNMWVLAEIGDKPGWMGLLMCFSGLIPFVGVIIGLVLSVMISIGVARTFERGVAFGIGLCFVPFIFYPILAFSRD